MSTRVVGVARERQIAFLGLALGPALLVAGLAVDLNAEFVARVLPIGRAWIQGAIALPMLVLAPALLSLSWSDEALEPAAKWLSRGLALAILLGVVALIAGTTHYLGCRPVTDRLETLPLGAALGAVIAGGFFAAVAAGRWFASSERPMAAVIAGVVVGCLSFGADVVAFAVANPGLTCVPVPA